MKANLTMIRIHKDLILFYDLMRYFSSVKVQEDVRIDSYSVSGATYQDGLLTVKFTVWPKSINRETMTSY